MSNIDNYQQDIIFYKSAGSTNTQILAWLEDHGVSTSERTLELPKTKSEKYEFQSDYYGGIVHLPTRPLQKQLHNTSSKSTFLPVQAGLTAVSGHLHS